jgi:protein O-mannosyl-transferase
MRPLLLLFLMTWSAICLAQPSGTSLKKLGNAGSKTYAVVVGISDYQDTAIPDLRFAHKDAEAFANFLRSPAGGALDSDHLKVLTNEQATAGRIAEALDALIEQAGVGDQVIIYFSGHGDVERKTVSQPGFLLAWDAPSRVYMGGGTYSLAFLQEVVTTLSTQNMAKVIVITDACHAGKLSGSQIGGAQLTSANLAKQYANEVKILSCQPNEFSQEGTQWGGGRGAFSYHLVDGLFGLADRNNDGIVTVGELDRYLEDNVTAEVAPQSQVPMLLGNKSDRLARVNEALLAEIKKVKNTGMPIFAATESRGLEDDILAKLDSGIIKGYFAFKKAVAEKRFIPDASGINPHPSADELYASLSAEPGLAPLHGFMKRNYAAALQDDAQQVLNTMLKSGLTSEVLSEAKAAHIYRDYPTYLDRAAELLGSGHYMYAALKARKHYFEGTLQTKKAERKQQFFQALHWQADMPHAFAALIELHPAEQADSAEYYAAKAMQIAPAWVRPYINLAYFYHRSRHLDKTEELLNRAWQLDSNSILVWYEKAGFYQSQNRHDAAEQWYLKAIAGSGEDICFPCAYNNLGLVYRNTGRYAEAEQHYKKAIQLDSTFAMAYRNLGDFYANTGRYAEAEQHYKKAIQLDSAFAMAYKNLGDFYANTGRYAEAEQQFKKAIQLDSTFAGSEGDICSPCAYNNLGGLYLTHLKRYAEAEQQFKKAIQLDSTFSSAYYNLACLQSLQNQTDTAFGYLATALKYGFNDYNWMQHDSDFAPLREQKERWEALMQNAIVPDTTDARAWNMLGQVYIRASNYAPAEAAIRKAVALDATSAPYRSNLGFVYLNLGRYAEAEAALTKAIALDSTFANPRKHLGMVCFKTNRPEDARQSFLKAIELNPNYMPSYLGMAYLLTAEGKTEEAIGYAEQAIGKGSTLEQLESDEDLAPLRALPEWQALRKKHLPESVKE